MPAASAQPLPQGAGGRPILYQVVAQHRYAAQGPEDLDLQPGDTVDVLCEGGARTTPPTLGPPGTRPGTGAVASPAVDEAWLEGHREGHIGIFPKCFVAPAGGRL